MSLASLALVVGLYGCESPEAFHISGDGSLLANGTGGDALPSTGGAIGSGGIVASSGGAIGSGGISLATGGTKGSGGAAGHAATGGTAGSGHGGSASGGATGGTVASGGTHAGGAVGTGGRSMGGSVGTGGIAPGTGGSGNTGNTGGRGAAGGSVGGGGSAGGAVGTGPCAGLCTPATQFKFTSGTTYQSGDLGTTAACYETTTTLTIQGGGCSNCTVSSPARTVKINGATAANNGSWTSIPAKINGGYCIQITAGNPAYTQFYTF
jgi:hypothetical protein